MITQFAAANMPNHSKLINQVISRGQEQPKHMQVLLVKRVEYCYKISSCKFFSIGKIYLRAIKYVHIML